MWVSELVKLGHKPEVEVLEEISKEVDVNSPILDIREAGWIKHYVTSGAYLLNIHLVKPILLPEELSEKTPFNFNTEVLLDLVRQRRKLAGLTQEEFADRVGVALTVVRKIEQGKTNINLEGLLIVLSMFGCTLNVSKSHP